MNSLLHPFFDWCEDHNLGFQRIESFHVSAYIEELLKEKSKPTVKQHLAAIRITLDEIERITI